MKSRYLAFILLACLAGISLNVGAHEIGHYLAASSYNLQPEFHLENNTTHISTNTFLNPIIAYVSYQSDSPNTTSKDATVALFGPITNLLLASLFFSLKYFSRKPFTKQLAFLLFSISLISAGINLIPLEFSDGSIIFKYLAENIFLWPW